MVSETHAAETALTLRVTAGLHAGARASLDDKQVVVIGRDKACDLCLMDDGIADRHLALVLSDTEPELRAFDTSLRVNGKLIARQRQALSIPCELQLGQHCTVVLETQDRQADSLASPDEPYWRTPAWAIGASLALLIGLGYALPRNDAGDARPTPGDLRAMLITELEVLPGGDALSISLHGSQLIVSGVVTADQRVEIKEALARHRPAPTVNLISEAELLAQVQEVFAGNGYEAEVRYLGEASVQIVNLDGANPAVARVAEHARRDVSGLRELSVLPAPPDVDDTALTMADLGGNARLSRIVDGETAYLASADGGRYFVGSILPSGHRVRQITKAAVQLDREGRIDWVQF